MIRLPLSPEDALALYHEAAKLGNRLIDCVPGNDELRCTLLCMAATQMVAVSSLSMLVEMGVDASDAGDAWRAIAACSPVRATPEIVNRACSNLVMPTSDADATARLVAFALSGADDRAGTGVLRLIAAAEMLIAQLGLASAEVAELRRLGTTLGQTASTDLDVRLHPVTAPGGDA